MIHDETREADVQKICSAILDTGVNMDVDIPGDYGVGIECPFCHINGYYNDSMADIIHEPDCVYLIAKNLTTR